MGEGDTQKWPLSNGRLQAIEQKTPGFAAVTKISEACNHPG